MQAVVNSTQSNGSRTQRRAGFTLLELMIVIVIIGILVGLILPAVNNIWGNVRVTQVKAEISQLETGIANFKNKFGMEPPSRIVLWENPATANGWAAGSPSADALAARAYLRQMWPQFNFAATMDIDGDGATTTNPITLTGGEALVFFLGGIWKDGPTGFSKNPSLPFSRGGNREGPFFEFAPSRFVDVDGDNFREYVDPMPGQTMPLQYFSSYDGAGYRTGASNGEFVSPGLQYPYLQSKAPLPAANPDTNAQPWKQKSFQIISPGRDRKLGIGGNYDLSVASSQLGGVRTDEQDNITNFSEGVLGR